MRKFSLSVLTVLVFVLMAVALVLPGNIASADPEVQRVGLVIAYTEGQSITIVDRDGNQFVFELASPLKIVPADRANMLAPGAYVTIIAPNNVPNGKHIAQGIVIHPGVPEGFPIPTASSTPLPTETMLPTEVPSETPTAIESPTETVTATATSTETATPTGTLTVTTSAQPAPQSTLNGVIEWLASLLRQIFAL